MFGNTNPDWNYLLMNPAEEQMTGLSDVGYENHRSIKPVKVFHYKPNQTLHIVLSGKGTYQIEDKTFYPKEGDIFYTPANVSLRYFADPEDPWEYVWFSMTGDNLAKYVYLLNLDKDSPCRSLNDLSNVKDILSNAFRKTALDPTQKVFHFASAFMEIIACEGKCITSHTDQKLTYVQTVKDLINKNYASPDFTIDALCSMMHLSHSYVCRIFSNIEDCTVASYMESVRLAHAADLLANTNHNVSRIAAMVGYNDPLHFMKRFKLKYGITALNYRRHKFLESK